MTELEEYEQQVAQFHQTILSANVWALQQSADLRAKAELMREIDEDVEVYGTTDPEEVAEMADKVERIVQLVSPYAQI